MPGDTPDHIISDTAYLPPPEMNGEPVVPDSGDAADLFVVFGLILILFLVVTLRTRNRKRARNRKLAELEKLEIHFRQWLEAYNPYYRKLDYSQKDRFRKRVLAFMASKSFHFVDMPEEERAKVLISAAAVQLTFGLDVFELDYFTDIHILKRDYQYGLYNVPFEGHVSRDGIYLSWAHFEHAYADYTDGVNVGLHEMAHALTYVNFVEMQGADEGFRKRFYTFSKTGRPVFNSLKDVPSPFLGEYAATNYNEFWAVCVEQFFERPEHFRIFHPQLFNALMELLNQDPRIPGKILKPIENE